MAVKIFINYRRKLNLVEAQLLQKVLQRHFGKTGVFLDVSGLEGGQHWLHTLERQVDESAAMVSLVGAGWADIKDEKGARRLDSPDDFVRFEIARAFARKIPVLPLRLDGAEIPETADLPLNLQQLAFQQAMFLRRESFDDDSDKIARRLRDLIAEARTRGVPRWAIGVSAAAALAAGIAAGPLVQTELGILKPNTEAALRTALGKAEERAGEAQKAFEGARKAQREAEASYAAAKRERDRAQVALSTEQVKRESAETRIADLTARLKGAEKQSEDAATALKAANERAGRAGEELAKLHSQPLGAPQPAPPDPGGQAAKPLPAAEASALKPGDSFRDCENCPEMVVVPAGSFAMGSDEPEQTSAEGQQHQAKSKPWNPFAFLEGERKNPEGPEHEVGIAKPFAAGKYAVTFAEWDACVADGGCGGYRPDDKGWGRGDHPVINVSWDDAKAYVKWLSQKTDKQYRLLSEAEREYVTRAGTGTPFWWGTSITPEQANYDGTNTGGTEGQKGEYRQKTVPVASFQPNPWGLYQVHGNVWEWVEDCWHDSYKGAPSDGSAWTSGNCDVRVLRGGSLNADPQYLRAAYRHWDGAADRVSLVGFRVARTF
jgi:formylglycine-generating enzyme required for sulfatase activity